MDEIVRGRPALLCDTSGSMIEYSGGRAKIDILGDVLGQLLTPAFVGSVWEFNSLVTRLVPPYRLGIPSGGTDLATALAVVGICFPRPLIVISDGLPNDAEAALAAARGLETAIVARFVGRDDDFAALAFMRALAWCSADGLGDFAAHRWDRPGLLRTDLAQLLLSWERER